MNHVSFRAGATEKGIIGAASASVTAAISALETSASDAVVQLGDIEDRLDVLEEGIDFYHFTRASGLGWQSVVQAATGYGTALLSKRFDEVSMTTVADAGGAVLAASPSAFQAKTNCLVSFSLTNSAGSTTNLEALVGIYTGPLYTDLRCQYYAMENRAVSVSGKTWMAVGEYFIAHTNSASVGNVTLSITVEDLDTVSAL